MSVLWSPHPGSQTNFMQCPSWEIMYTGTRGRGSTDAGLFKFAKHIGKFGAAWRGVIYRTKYKNLDEIKVKGKQFFYQAFPGCQFHESKSDYKFVWPTGEELLLRAIDSDDDYWSYHGHEYPFIMFDELTTWKTDYLYEALQSCSRSSKVGLPRYYISTTNPYGPGHNWVKEYWIDPKPARSTEGTLIEERVRFDGDLLENTHLMEASPEYIERLDNIKNEALRQAWRYGDWSINVGGFFDGYWFADKHVIKPFEIPLSWPRWRTMDWGFAKPYSVGWYTQDFDKIIYRYRELYGWGGKADKGTRETAAVVAGKIYNAEEQERKAGIRFINNPADDSIWSELGSETAIVEDFLAKGIVWHKAGNQKRSRISGWDACLKVLENDSFKVFNCCRHFIRTVPNLMPDNNNPEDVDCWVGETLVSTPEGAKRIDEILIGEMVNTPIGPRSVLKSYYSGLSDTILANLSNGDMIEGTPDHKVYVINHGLVPLSELKPQYALSMEKQAWVQKILNIMVSSIDVIRVDGTMSQAAIAFKQVLHHCIGRYGLITRARFQKACTFITEMVMQVIMRSVISSVLGQRTTQGFTTQQTGQLLGLDKRSGAVRKKGKNNLEKISKRVERNNMKEGCRASIVEMYLLLDTMREYIARMNAWIKQTTLWQKNVVFAEILSEQKNITRKKCKLVRINAVGRLEGKKQVYNLTIEGAHLFYANGILSSNTTLEDHAGDEWRYSIISRRRPPKVETIKPVLPLHAFDRIAKDIKRTVSPYHTRLR